MSAMHGSSGIGAPTIQGYELFQVLGGGTGIAYLARQEALNRLVCVKVMTISDDEDAELSRARFNREAELLASVSHPNILSVFDFGVTADSGLPYLVTESIEKGDLRRLLTAGEPLPVGQARSILGQVGEAVIGLLAFAPIAAGAAALLRIWPQDHSPVQERHGMPAANNPVQAPPIAPEKPPAPKSARPNSKPLT